MSIPEAPACSRCLYVVEDIAGHECHYDPPRISYDPAVWKRHESWHEETYRRLSAENKVVARRGYVFPDSYAVWPIVPPDGCCGRFIHYRTGATFEQVMGEFAQVREEVGDGG